MCYEMKESDSFSICYLIVSGQGVSGEVDDQWFS